MTKNSTSERIEALITSDCKLAFTLISFLASLVILLNLTFTNLLVIGVAVALIYLTINGTFLGNFLFKEERFAMKLLLGNLILLAFLGFVSWIITVISNLGVVNTVIVLFIVAAFCSLINQLKTKP